MSESIDPNLVSSWRAHITQNGQLPLSDALEHINNATGRSYKHHHIIRLERGVRGPSPPVINYMMELVLPALLAQKGLNRPEINQILDTIRIPERESD